MSPSAIKAAAANGLLLLCATALGFAACEAGLRIVRGVDLSSTENFRASGVSARNNNLTGVSEYDPILGWTLKSGYRSASFNTLPHGIRANGPSESVVRTGGILAVGDSFTAGSEVWDGQSWPAQLEKIIGEPVVNAGIGGYGTDQIVLRAEQLLPIVRPKVLLVGILDGDIPRAGFDVYGSPKPYFTIDHGRLVHWNDPVPRVIETEDRHRAFKDFLGHSLVVDQAMGALAPWFWYLNAAGSFRRIPTNEVDVTCRLLKRLKERTDALGVRSLIVMQYDGYLIINRSEPTGIALSVERCASQMGFQIVDEFESLRAIATAGAADFRSYYMMTGDVYGHMSERGNLHVARLIAAGLARPPVAGSAAGFVPLAFAPGDGRNLVASVPLVELFPNTVDATIARAPIRLGRGPRPYILAAKGRGVSGHYVATAPFSLAAGAYTLSMEARAWNVGRFRIQVEGGPNAVVGNVDLAQKEIFVDEVGRVAGAGARITSVGNGWYRLSMTGGFAAGQFRILLQATGKYGEDVFRAKGEAVMVRDLQLERGQTALRYESNAAQPR